MRSVLLAVFLFSASVMAQPWGPYEIAATSDSLQTMHSPQIAIVDSQTARVFYTLDVPGQSEIQTALYDLVNHRIIGTSELARADSVTRTLLDAAVDGPANWVLIFNRRFNQNWVDTKFLLGPAVNAREEYMGTTGEPNVPWLSSYYLSDTDLVPRVGGGWLLTWVQITISGPYYESSSQIFVAGLSADSLEYRQSLIPNSNGMFGPFSAAAVSVARDSGLVLTEGLWGLGGPIASTLLRAVAGADSSVLDTVCTYDCSIHVLSFQRAANGSLLAYTEPNTLLSVNEARECETLGSLSPGYAPADLAFQAEYGFAGIWTNPSWILLGRMHENGAPVEPGVFYWRNAEYVIRGASVAIAPDGRIYVVWTESSSAATRLMIARINWDTPLGASDQDFTPPPSSFHLSAYPNPFNNVLRVSYAVPRAQQMELAVFNVLGQKVETLFAGTQTAGAHEAAWSPRGAGGIYFLSLTAGTQTQTTKVLYIR